jgi:hypothetical protein
MRIEKTLRSCLIIPVIALLLVTGCGGDSAPDPASDAVPGADEGAAVSDQGTAPETEAVVEVPDACVLFDRMELEQTLGWELYDPDPDDMPPGLYACSFGSPPLFYATRKYPDPALPESIGFSSLNINTHPSTIESFEEFREMIGEAGEDVPGIGDGAYFYGYDMIYGRVGGKGFSMRIYTAADTDEERALVREMMLTLARKAAAKLQ